MKTIDISSAIENNERCVEGYKTLRTNIQFSGIDTKVICVTSTIPNEGKTTTCINLAKELSETGKRVVLIDADLRGSILLKMIKSTEKLEGITNFFAGQNTLNEIVCHTNYQKFDLMFTGPFPPNPAELLGSSYFEDMIKHLKNIYYYIVIDTSPLGVVVDAAVVAKLSDGVVIVTEYDKVSYKRIKKVRDQLLVADAKILGVVLNKVPMGRGSRYKYYNAYDNYYVKSK